MPETQKASLLPIEKPEAGKPVKAVIKHFSKWDFMTDIELVAVDESDCDWRFVDDNAELSYDWNVVYWEYITPGENDGS